MNFGGLNLKLGDVMQKRALIIDDDLDIQQVVAKELECLDFFCDTASDGIRGLDLATSRSYELVVLDLQLPRLEGVEVCKQIRSINNSLPIIILSSLPDENTKVLLLELGADDYVTKPFSPRELKARIKTVMRRCKIGTQAPGNVEKVLSIGEVLIDLAKRRVTISDQQIDLTAREFALIAKLATEPGRPFSRDELNEELYGYYVDGYEKSINSYVNRIRAKIEIDPANPRYLLTARGVGYYFAEK